MMHVREPRPSEAALLERMRQAGIVLDYAFVSDASSGVEPQSVHREAAWFGLRSISENYRIDAEIHEPGLAGRQISVDNFYGWHFDREEQRLRMRASQQVAKVWRELYTSHDGVKGSLTFELGYGPYQWADDTDPNHALWVQNEVDLAYSHAFVDPPYPILGLAPPEIPRLFLAVDKEVLHRPHTDTEIWWWEGGPWADYFLPGLEWWARG